MSEDQRPLDDAEPTRDGSAEIESDPDATREPGGIPPDVSTTRRLGDFDQLREIGRGGMGVVYEARQISLKRRVALKVLPPALGMSAQAKQRFEREAQAAAKLHHTNIVPVHAIGEHDGHHFYAMDLIDGQSLDHVLRDMVDDGANPLMEATVTQTVTELRPQQAERSPQDQATTSLSDTSAGGREWFDTVAKLMADVADALHYAHGRGVIHRDIKPANLMLSREGHLSVTDFGLARLLEEPGMTVSGSLLGTPAYMSPEQIAAGRIKVDHRTDVYSLGVVLYEMLTLQRPFPGESREEILNGVLTQEPRSPRRINGWIPVDLETICLKAMEKEPDRRYRTAGELASDLRQYLQHGLIAARRAGLLLRTVKWSRRHPVASTVMVGLVVVAVVSAVAYWQYSGRSEEATQRRVAEARLMLIQGDLRKALGTTNGILASDPDNVDGLLIRARVSLHRHHYREAVDDARQILAGDPGNWEAHLLAAAAAKKGDLYSIPIDRHLEVVEASVPDTVDAYFLRGFLAACDTERDREAISWLDKALELDPGHAFALETRSEKHEVLKNLAAAMADAERLIAANPRSAQGYIKKASIFHERHDQDSVLAMANRAIEVDPENPDGYGWRAAVQARRGQIGEVISDLTRAIDVDPTAFYYRRRATAYYRNGDAEAAIADARRAIEREPDCAGCYETLIWIYWRSNRKDEAIDVLNEFEKTAENWVQEEGQVCRHSLWLDYYLQTEDYERALDHAMSWVRLRPQGITARNKRLRVRRLAGDEAAVVEECDLLGALELEAPPDFAYRGNTMRDKCHREEMALADYSQAIALAPSWADPYYERALLHETEGELELALADMEKSVELAPNWTVAVDNLARLRTALDTGR
jgi:tetratricopeptide (TPR) repeat protein